MNSSKFIKTQLYQYLFSSLAGAILFLSIYIFYNYLHSIPLKLANYLIPIILGALIGSLFEFFIANYKNRSKVENELKATLSLLQILIDTIPSPIFYKDAKGIYAGCNKAFTKYLGLKEKEIIGKSVFELAPREIAEKYYEMDSELLKQGGTQSYEWQVKGADNVLRDVIFYKAVYKNPDGINEGIIGIMLDISERKKAEKKLEESLSLLNSTLDATADGIIALNNDGNWTTNNQQFLNIWKINFNLINKKETIRILKNIFSHLKNPENPINSLKKIRENNNIESHDLIEFKDGRIFESISKPQILSGKSIGRVFSFRDITEQKKLEQLREDTENIIRHDLKNPITAILGFCDLMKNEITNKDNLLEYIQYIESGCSQILNQIDKSLDLYKMENGLYQLSPVKFDIVNLFFDLNQEFIKITKNKTIQIKIITEANLKDNENSIIYGEAAYIKQLFSNLIRNAIEASPENQVITIDIKKEDPFFSISIHNCGEIPIQIQKRFFEKNVSYGKKGGTGLGTYSAKLIAEAHNGKISFTSSKTEGTSIKVLLPINPS